MTLLDAVAGGFTDGKRAVDGFATNTAQYVPLREPWLSATQVVAGQPVTAARFYEYNRTIDEAGYVADMHDRLTAAGWPGSAGMIVDTSRNGWGGAGRPGGPSTQLDLERFVNESRVDRRAHRSLWCNVAGAGLGELPQAAAPSIAPTFLDALVWVKTPGESDGASADVHAGLYYDRECDPAYTTQYGVHTGALADAPPRGTWFPAQFAELVQNAYPALAQAPTFALTVTLAGTGAGAVASSPGGIACGAACSAAFAASTVVTLTAAAAAGSSFGGWTGACATAGAAPTCTVSMTQAQAVTATFSALGAQPLTVLKSGTGMGFVTSSPAGIQCGATCAASFGDGAAVTLTATPASGSTFSGWSGACSGYTSCTVVMSSAREVTAIFISGQPRLTVTTAGTGSGTVAASPAGVSSCGAGCTVYPYGAEVTLAAVPAEGSTFTGWGGACTGAGACVVAMTDHRAVTAIFQAAPDAPCANAITFSWSTGNFDTTGAVCYRTSQTVRGWGCSNMAGRTVRVNGGAPTASCGAGPFPLAKHPDGSTYFAASAGQHPWASIHVW